MCVGGLWDEQVGREKFAGLQGHFTLSVDVHSMLHRCQIDVNLMSDRCQIDVKSMSISMIYLMANFSRASFASQNALLRGWRLRFASVLVGERAVAPLLF